MPYSSLTNLELKERFGIEQAFQDRLFDSSAPQPASDLLRETLRRSIPFALLQGSEKARSEFIIAPILLELREQLNEQISIFSGIDFTVDAASGLAGVCDFLISRSPYQAALETPVVIAVEAKRQDFEQGITQCIAEMIAARIYNERRGQVIEEIYGAVTTGDVWRFIVLRGKRALIETVSFDVRQDLEMILGILRAMAQGNP